MCPALAYHWMLPMDARDCVTHLTDHWNLIEERLKRAEHIRNGTNIAAINELRYAGRKLIDAWNIFNKDNRSKEDEDALHECIAVAKQYLINADHDISDGICLFIHSEIQAYIRKFGIKTITKYFHEFPTLLVDMGRVNQIVSNSRSRRDERIVLYKDISDNYIPKLIDFHERLITSAELALAEEKRETFIRRAALAFGAIASAITIVTLFVCQG